MKRIFSGLVDTLLQMHARDQVMNEFGLYSVYMHSSNIYLLDYFGDSIIFDQIQSDKSLEYIPQVDLLVSKKD